VIVVTGGAGFIGSAFIWKLNQLGREDILAVDVLDTTDKWKNLVNRRFAEYWDHKEFLQRVNQNDAGLESVEAIVHLGACSATTERDANYLMENNYRYTQTLAEWCLKKDARFIYASSGATYGEGAGGYSDADEASLRCKPLNMYGYSKQLLDVWSIKNGYTANLVGLKFFNVFGPNEYHKDDMRSVVHKAFGQIQSTGRVSLFKSHRPEYRDGEQVRDFVYVKDVTEVMAWFLEHPKVNGIFNVGTGRARTWKDLAQAVFTAMDKPVQIDYIPMPEHLRDRYQYRTEADISKLKQSGCPVAFRSLEDAVGDYVRHYLLKGDPYLE
jgi:ADP-L-glycero-D-manno-heptose 6-epimerase